MRPETRLSSRMYGARAPARLARAGHDQPAGRQTPDQIAADRALKNTCQPSSVDRLMPGNGGQHRDIRRARSAARRTASRVDEMSAQ